MRKILFMFGIIILSTSLINANAIPISIIAPKPHGYISQPHNYISNNDKNLAIIGAENSGFTNNDLIYNTTKLCWYKSETKEFYGDCAEEKIRIEKIEIESENRTEIHWQDMNFSDPGQMIEYNLTITHPKSIPICDGWDWIFAWITMSNRCSND